MRIKTSFVALSFVFVATILSGQIVKPFTVLKVIKTEYFDIIFPEESRRSALALASYADETYRYVSGLLDIQVPLRIPVTITPHTDEFNGYMNPLPYPHIVLFDVPMDVEWSSYRNSLYSLFLHELTHAVSLSSRGPFFKTGYDIFGGIVLPAALNAPLFMVEGVTVSFESLEGFGRANDPLVKERIRQAIHEGTFLTPFQASGVYDKPPLGKAYYEYGGLFSAYIQKNYGMEKYAELWKQMGTRFPISIRFYKHGFYRIFRDVYGVDFLDAWDDFAASLAITGLEENSAGTITQREYLIQAMDSGGGRVFTLDRIAAAVDSFDPITGSFSRVLRTDIASVALDVSEDGRRLLLSGYRYKGEQAIAITTEYEQGKPTGRTWEGLYKPRYFRQGLVALDSDLHFSRLVYVDGEGKKEVLLTGNSELQFSDPAPLDEDRIAFIVAEQGVRRIGVYDFNTQSAALFISDLPDDTERWRYVRNLRASEGRLYFSYVHDDRFYKLGIIGFTDAGAPTAIFASRDFSGGVFTPVAAGTSIFYRAAFSTWDALMRYPEEGVSIQGIQTELHLEPWSQGLSDSNAGYTKSVTGNPSHDYQESSYSGLRYMNPLRLWLPTLLLRQAGTQFRLDGGGFISYISTPTDMNTFLLDAGFDAQSFMGYAHVLWNSLSLGPPLALDFSDSIEFVSGNNFDEPYRRTSLSANVAFEHDMLRLRLHMIPSFQGVWLAREDEDVLSAYEWGYEEGIYTGGLTLGISSLQRFPWRLFGRGFLAAAQYRRVMNSWQNRYDLIFRAALEPEVPLRLSAYGAWDEGGQDLDGYSDRFGYAQFSQQGAVEYVEEVAGGLSWVAGTEIEAKLFTLETQGNFSHLYFNRLFGTLAYRGVFYDAGGSLLENPIGFSLGEDARYLHSLLVKAGAVISAVPIATIPFSVSPYMWLAWKLSNMEDSTAENDVIFGFALSMEW